MAQDIRLPCSRGIHTANRNLLSASWVVQSVTELDYCNLDAGSHVPLCGDLCVNSLFQLGLIIGCHVFGLTFVGRKCPRGIVFITFLGRVIKNFEGFAHHDHSCCVGPPNAQPYKWYHGVQSRNQQAIHRGRIAAEV